jgi:hypothetical protein
MPPGHIVAALIGLAALGGPMGRQMSMAAVRTEEGKAAALEWLGMVQGKSEEELWEAVREPAEEQPRKLCNVVTV